MSDLAAEWSAAERALQQTMRPAILVFAIGTTGLIVGTLIATLSEGGETPGVVILTLSAPLFAAGLVWMRRVASRHRYRLTYRFSPIFYVLMLVCCVAAVAVSLALGALS